jgi:TolA-binding protein
MREGGRSVNDDSNVKDDGLDPGATGAVRLMRDRNIDVRTPATRARSFRVLGTRLGAMRERARKRRLVAIGVSCAALAAAIGFGARPRFDGPSPSALTYTVNGGAPVPGGYILPAPAAAAPMLSFSDGTRIQMAAEARGRVVEIDRHGGRIALEDGKAQVQVVHRPGARWVFEAGPFLINVQGTAFSFGWNGRDARFELQMDSGVVSVTGPVSGGEIVLRAGQRLAIDLHDRKTARAVQAAPAEAPPAAGAPPAGHSPAQAAGSERWSPEGWGARLAQGRADLIVADARRIGLAKVLDRGSSEELAALASAARYQRDDALARRALLTQRHRFPRSMRAVEASFLLGRIDDESDSDSRRALDWYDRYLREAPAGSYVSEALGRKMMVLQRTGRQGQASDIATDYLRRFPTGTYAHAARALVRAP